MWSLQSETTYVAAPCQSWIDEYFSWVTGPDCCKYNEVTLEVCQANYDEYNTIPEFPVDQLPDMTGIEE